MTAAGARAATADSEGVSSRLDDDRAALPTTGVGDPPVDPSGGFDPFTETLVID
jgi:hypothetical protein